MNYVAIATELKAAKQLIVNPENWQQGYYGGNEQTRHIPTQDWKTAKPTCFCSLGALIQIQHEAGTFTSSFKTITGDTAKFLDPFFGGDTADFNDNHSHAEVLDAWDAAIEAAEQLAIKQNLESLIVAVEAQPEEKFDLDRYKQETDCGTAFCTAGLASTMPEFQAQGLNYQKIPNTERGMVYVGTLSIWYRGVSDPMFGPDSFTRLFEPAGVGALDGLLGYDDEGETPNMTDKELALARLRNQLQTINEIIATKGE